MTTTAAEKRKGAPPRKAAKKGSAAESLSPASLDDLRVPEEFKPATDRVEPPVAVIPEPPQHLYGDVPVYTFIPKKVKDGDSLDPIHFPHISTINADVEFFWEMDQLDPMHQTFRYMERAKVPKPIQRRVVRLPDDELGRFIQGWFMGIVTPQGVSPPGES